MYHRATLVLPTVVGQNRLYTQIVLPVERQYMIVQDVHCRLLPLAHVELPEGVAAVGVDDGVQVDLADPFELADVEQVLGQQFAWSG